MLSLKPVMQKCMLSLKPVVQKCLLSLKPVMQICMLSLKVVLHNVVLESQLCTNSGFYLCRSVEGVLGFLAEALASLGRRPQFYWGLMQSLLPSRTPAAESGRSQDEVYYYF